ncbi:MAG TPA: hypothetical protein VI298_12835 [Geobacteraceae bacterium]
MRVPLFTIYAKNAGVEISPYEKRQENKPREGRISLRFFKMESGAQQLRFVAEPWEGFELYRMLNKVFREGGKEILTHKFEGSEGEIITKLTVEKYERNNKAGYALVIQRGDDSINVAATAGNFLYAAEFLRHLSLTEAWVEQPGPGNRA